MCSLVLLNNKNLFLIHRIHEIEQKSFTTPWNYSSIETEFSNPLSFSFALMHNDILKGYLFSIKLFDEIQINKLCISVEFRRNSFGTKLINYVIEEARKRSIKRIFLEVNEHNSPAVKLYKNAGFFISRIRKNIYEQKDNGFEMMLNLKP